MIKFAHIVYIPFTGVGIWGKKSDEWLKHRIEIFKRYTLQSLLNQSSRAFLVWISFRPEERDNVLIHELLEHLKEIKLPVITSYNGLMYWDDKFSGGWDRILNMGRIVRQAYRERDWKQLLLCFSLFKNKNSTLLERLNVTLWDLSKIKEFQDANYIYVTRIDSDDMFHKEAMAEIQGIMPFEGALIYGKGYIYNANSGIMSIWDPKTNPPFHTIIFRGSVFFNPLEHLRYYRNFRSHEDVPKIFKTQKLPDFRYCVVVHGNHISTNWNHAFRKEEVLIDLLNDFCSK